MKIQLLTSVDFCSARGVHIHNAFLEHYIFIA